MFIKSLFYIIILLLLFSPAAEGSQDIITVNYPPDRTVMEFDLLSVSLSVPRGYADVIYVTVNNKNDVKIVPDNTYECFSVPLLVGINRIAIRPVKDKKNGNEIVFDVFRRSELESEYKNAPPGFQKVYFHMKDRQECTGCHTLEPGTSDRKPVKITAFPGEYTQDVMEEVKATSTCYSCHKSITSYPFIHGPSSVWSCLSCHDPGAEIKYDVRKPYTKVCYSCHVKQKEDRATKRYIHGPLITGKCTICHNPHSAENPFNLIKSTWNLCVSCHIEKGSGEHIVKSFPDKYFHPTRGVPDPLRKGKELTCASCHEPHASDAPHLWRLDVASGFALCRQCHNQ